MKYYILLVLTFISTIGKAENKVKVYYEKIENGYNIFADNEEFCQVSIKIDFTTTNLGISEGNNNIYIIDPLSKKQLLTTLTVIKKGKAFKFSYKTLTNYGNHNINKYDGDYIYDLPFSTSHAFKIYQGYNGNFSHQNENSLDFTMPVGTEIKAIREGVVIKVIDENSKSCGEEECKKYNNLIIVYHTDGTFAEYTHIKHKGSTVKVGDNISKGQLLAYSGNVGWSTGPHLHLVVFLQKLDKRVTLKTKFRTGSGEKTELLVEKNEYSRDY